MDDQFKTGDVVMLKSGGPGMTVADTGDYSGLGMGPKNGVRCDWINVKGERVTEVFDAAQLKVGPTR